MWPASVSVEVVVAATVPVTLPLLPLLLAKTENPWLVLRTLAPTKCRDGGLTRDLRQDVRELGVQCRAAGVGGTAGRRLRCQGGEPVEQGRDVVERTILDLEIGQPVVGVPDPWFTMAISLR